MKCNGIDAVSGENTQVSFNGVIDGVDTLLAQPEERIYLSPGFIDIQVNGFAGVDYNSPVASAEDIAHSIRCLYATGVTRFFPTVITGSPHDMAGALRNLAHARGVIHEGPAMEGFHVEGPFISPDDGPRGAHPKQWVRPPDLNEFHRMQDAAQDLIRLITVSPEWPETAHFIEEVVREGVAVSIGHTKAEAGQINDAVKAGATLSTHLGNGAHSVMTRHPNYIWEQLAEDRLAASFIVDGIHLGKSFLRVALRAKGVERAVLITDAVMPAGCSPGQYKLGEVDVELHPDGSVRLLGGTRLAGSALLLDHAIGNVMRLTGVTLRDAITMATRNPARIGRIAKRQRGLAVGERADLVRFRYDDEAKEIHVLETFVDGERVFHG
ncbi:MAG TPA: amidohydrolase family protein [Bryobacteraceae bacterium]|nr:amidohydrolase family protein [Bryobacteraceae bacterium]